MVFDFESRRRRVTALAEKILNLEASGFKGQMEINFPGDGGPFKAKKRSAWETEELELPEAETGKGLTTERKSN